LLCCCLRSYMVRGYVAFYVSSFKRKDRIKWYRTGFYFTHYFYHGPNWHRNISWSLDGIPVLFSSHQCIALPLLIVGSVVLSGAVPFRSVPGRSVPCRAGPFRAGPGHSVSARLPWSCLVKSVVFLSVSMSRFKTTQTTILNDSAYSILVYDSAYSILVFDISQRFWNPNVIF
jgi:hypothetical protein